MERRIHERDNNGPYLSGKNNIPAHIGCNPLYILIYAFLFKNDLLMIILVHYYQLL
jgi:hypothetical protein